MAQSPPHGPRPPSATDAVIAPVPEQLRNEAHGSTPASNNVSSDHAVPLQLQISPAEPLSTGAVPSRELASTTSFDRDNFIETKESGRAPHTGSAEQSSKRTLWDQAVALLQESQEGPAIVGIVKEFTSNPTASPDGSPDSVKGLAKDITEEMEREIKRQPQDDHRHRFIEKTISILNKFIAVGDVVVSFDPVHAALPWAAVRFVLVTLTASSELKSQLLGGIAKVTSLVLQCHTYRRLYIESDLTLQLPENVSSALETSIIQAYAKSLLFLGFTIQRQRSWSKFVDASFKHSDIDKCIGGLLESGSQLAQAADDCEKHCNLLNRSTVNELHNIAKELRQEILDQTNLVLKIHQDFVLAKLRTAKGAAFDHLNQEREAKCHPGTRVALLDEIGTWASNSESHRIFWLQGMAGTGKSTISRTVARILADRKNLGASFFFKKGEVDRNSATRFFTTIASQLVRRLPALAQHMKEVIETDPEIGEKYLTVQFEKLILQPLKRLDHDRRISSETVVIVIDALDECDPESHATAIIDLLPQAKQLSSISLKFFVTSRPEFPIQSEFRKISGEYQDLILHRVDKYIVEKDLSVYFDSELSKIRDKYNMDFPNSPLPSNWPGQNNLQILVDRAVPLFIFAKTVCLFIQDQNCDPPDTQLNKILQYQTMGQESRLHAMYFPILDQMLMKRIDSGFIRRTDEEQKEIVEKFRGIVGALVILADPLPVKSLARLLEIEERIIRHRLSLLNSVLNIPSDVTAPVKTLHLSFRDFLIDPEMRATNPFWVDEEMTHGKLVTKCLKLLRDCLQEDICSLQRPGKSRADVDRQIFLKRLPSEIQYVCLYWVYHLKRSRRTVRDGDEVHCFLTGYLLYWLEVLGLIGRISESIGLIDDLQSLTDPETGVKISRFLHDCYDPIRIDYVTRLDRPIRAAPGAGAVDQRRHGSKSAVRPGMASPAQRPILKKAV
ncbi:hypothetical protein NEUTE2DRAFT_161157 [Neurospora tetrasperma FGSC 2509]|nr:hypothetical protein NEUTE2DRAFT_161157 [Neurospora tetrasperma FGSC 2509]